MKSRLRLGSRGSPLALRQSQMVIEALGRSHSALAARIETVIIKTSGDLKLGSIDQVTPGFFVKEIEQALKRGDIDLAAHSLKDLPSAETPGLTLAGYLPRQAAEDILCLSPRAKNLLIEFAAGNPTARYRIGTSSPRRAAAILARLPNCEIVPIRGNIETRLNKLSELNLDAILLAAAGPERLELRLQNSWRLPVELMVPAAGQGIVAIQCRSTDQQLGDWLSAIDNADSRVAANAERAFMARLAAGCRSAVGVHARLLDDETTIVVAQLFSLNGSVCWLESLQGPGNEARQIGTQLANNFLKRGAGKLLA